ncbi:MAG: LD-carboxypeptidase [Bacillales bacterium]|nr:LD-carboxypeptidase [Bacillales bacterium]
MYNIGNVGGIFMITYPFLSKGSTIGVSAPSSGVREDLHGALKLAVNRMKELGYDVFYTALGWRTFNRNS